jgi:hypothetical protein
MIGRMYEQRSPAPPDAAWVWSTVNSADAWRAVLDDLIERGLRRPAFLIRARRRVTLPLPSLQACRRIACAPIIGFVDFAPN